MSNNGFYDILNRMKDGIQTEADKREGTWTADNLQAVANELARIYDQDIETILPQAFVATADGENLDKACSDYGITRRQATAAEVLVTLTGTPGFYYWLEVYADELAFLVPEAIQIPNSGTVTAVAVCMVTGEVGNVAAGTISKASDRRITKVTNAMDATGGYDRETDEVLRERTLEHIRTPANSGNIAHYVQWAKEISGVHKVKVYDLARGAGTVDVVIIADDNTVPPPKLLEEVLENIETQRPIGADVQVLSAEAVDLVVEAQVIVQPGYTAEGVKNSLYKELKAYCEGIAFASGTISYLGIANRIFSCPGVVDVTAYTVNGGTASIQLQARQFPVAQQPVISVEVAANA